MDSDNAVMCAASSRMLQKIASFDEQRRWERDGATSMTAWLCARYGWTFGIAREWVRVAGVLGAFLVSPRPTRWGCCLSSSCGPSPTSVRTTSGGPRRPSRCRARICGSRRSAVQAPALSGPGVPVPRVRQEVVAEAPSHPPLDPRRSNRRREHGAALFRSSPAGARGQVGDHGPPGRRHVVRRQGWAQAPGEAAESRPRRCLVDDLAETYVSAGNPDQLVVAIPQDVGLRRVVVELERADGLLQEPVREGPLERHALADVARLDEVLTWHGGQTSAPP
jgi:hypothetical protein